VFGLPHPHWGAAVAVAVVLRGDAQLSADSLAQSLQGRLARFKLPRRLFVVTALPKTALGKVQRRALASMAASGDLGVGSCRE
jgi:acyl-CoA synthetase (AMP-forming)/AMP-acid ligase II